MKSKAESVDEYLTEVPKERLESLKNLRALCQTHLLGYQESMAYHMPSYKKNNVVEVAFASQKRYICVYILKHDVMLANEELLRGITHGKGCIRFANPSKIDYEVVTKLLKETLLSNGQIC